MKNQLVCCCSHKHVVLAFKTIFSTGVSRHLKQNLNVCKRCLHTSSQLRGQLYPTDDELYTRTNVSLLSKESTEVPYISKYSARGFTISGDVVVGPVAILPWSLVHWNVADVRDISKESLSLFHLLEPRIEILVIGTGSNLHRLNPELHKFMRSKGIAMEVQITPHACSIFNFLVGEGRVVAAGLIPPEQLMTATY